VLKGLQFTTFMIDSPTANLSGGWMMRVSLARGLFAKPDILLLDEPTNHLDLHGVLWLQNYLTMEREADSGNSSSSTSALSSAPSASILVTISHDVGFLESVATDIIVFADQTLSYFSDGYEAFVQHCEEVEKRDASRNSAVDKKKKQMHDFIQKQQASTKSKRGNDPNKQRQAKERRHKMGEGRGRKGGADRLTMVKDGGGKFNIFAGAGSNRASHLEAVKRNPVTRFKVKKERKEGSGRKQGRFRKELQEGKVKKKEGRTDGQKERRKDEPKEG
jgi:ATPase subunit of ABC transporter with duplicated ATPase domains